MRKAARKSLLILSMIICMTIVSFAKEIDGKEQNGTDIMYYCMDNDWDGWFTTTVSGNVYAYDYQVRGREMYVSYRVLDDGATVDYDDDQHAYEISLDYYDVEGDQVTAVFRMINPSTGLALITKTVNDYE